MLCRIQFELPAAVTSRLLITCFIVCMSDAHLMAHLLSGIFAQTMKRFLFFLVPPVSHPR